MNIRFDEGGNLYTTVDSALAAPTSFGIVKVNTGKFTLIGSTGLPSAGLDLAAATF